MGCWWPGEKLDPLSMPPGGEQLLPPNTHVCVVTCAGTTHMLTPRPCTKQPYPLMHCQASRGPVAGQQPRSQAAPVVAMPAFSLLYLPRSLCRGDGVGCIALYSDTGTAPCVCAGRDLPAGAVRALSATEKLVSLKQYKELAGKLTEAQRAESRRVLVAYLPVSCGLWQVRRAAASDVQWA